VAFCSGLVWPTFRERPVYRDLGVPKLELGAFAYVIRTHPSTHNQVFGTFTVPIRYTLAVPKPAPLSIGYRYRGWQVVTERGNTERISAPPTHVVRVLRRLATVSVGTEGIEAETIITQQRLNRSGAPSLEV
jgi:hypothetical protein